MNTKQLMQDNHQGWRRVVIENVSPRVEDGRFPIKRVVGDTVEVSVDLYADGHDAVDARLLYRKKGEDGWLERVLKVKENDRWTGSFPVDETGFYEFTVEGWVDHYLTWRKDVHKKHLAGLDVRSELLVGLGFILATAQHVDDDREREVLVSRVQGIEHETNVDRAIQSALADDIAQVMRQYPDRKWATRHAPPWQVLAERTKASFSTWYELFPRSWGKDAGIHGTLQDCERLLPEIARMGFDVLYFPPIHPIGITHRKGKNNVTTAGPEDPGSPWAIGSSDGGHDAIHPSLGDIVDLHHLIERAGELGIEIALDLAFQCSPDHPYLKEHPEWFKWRPDGTIQSAENPPKKYEDIVPLNFECEHWVKLWEELKRVVMFWVEHGVKIFRVDNPHTKPFHFWEWLIKEVRLQYPDVFFLAEAFTRPKVMNRLAKLGFSQSYTYFTWRYSKQELSEYLLELTTTATREFFRPNFWPNTPDILPEHLQYAGRSAFVVRLILAATLSANYGIYGPAFELLENEPYPEKEEYLNSEKYELKCWDWDVPGNLKEFITLINRIRREHPAFQSTNNLSFLDIENDYLICYTKESRDRSNLFLIAVNLDVHHIQSGWVRLPLERYGIDPSQPFLVHDLLSGARYVWQGEWNYIELDPEVLPAHVLHVHHHMRREEDFDYFF